jgi:hypothetical protein
VHLPPTLHDFPPQSPPPQILYTGESTRSGPAAGGPQPGSLPSATVRRGAPLPAAAWAEVLDSEEFAGRAAAVPTTGPAQVVHNGIKVTLQDVARFAPQLRLHPAEPYLPCSMDYLMQHSTLVDSRRRVVKASPQASDLYYHRDVHYALDIAEEAFAGQPLVDGRVRAPMYAAVQVPADGRFVDVTYIFLFAYNGPQVARVSAPGLHYSCVVPHFAEHQGDLECITVRLTPDCKKLLALRYEQHGVSQWLAPDAVEFAAGHPVVRCALHSHASYTGQGRVQAGHDAQGRAEGYYANARCRALGAGVEVVDVVSDNGPLWQPYAQDSAGHTDQNGQLLLLDRQADGTPHAGQRWSAFAGRLGVERRNTLTPVRGIGRSLSRTERMVGNALAQVAQRSGRLRPYNVAHGTPGFANREFFSQLP